MACYHPRIRVEDVTKWEKAKDGHLYHPAKVIGVLKNTNELESLKNGIIAGHYKYQIIGCKQCIGCRLDTSRDWANRGYLNSLMYNPDECWFVTLTYDNDHIHIPETVEVGEWIFDNVNDDWKGILVPKDIQQFVKNLRQVTEQKFQYMACGEYGGEKARPHYHCIIFGLKLPPEDFYNLRIINNEYYWQSKTIEYCWGDRKGNSMESKGISNISQATWNNIAYTARYITKKINGDESEFLYASKGQIKEFFRTSTRPAIGKPYFDKYMEEIYKNDEVIIKNKNGVVHSKPPEYFDRLYKEINPEHMEEIKERRRKSQESKDKLQDTLTSMFRVDRLEIEERAKESQSKMLRRSLEKKATQ